ncbi:MAG: MFS transporter [Solirubrobacterales bacterium]
MTNPRTAKLAWALTVGVVLADSSIVTLALPEILTEFDATVFGVSWVLTAFNLVFALALIPAAIVARRTPGSAWAAGVVVFVLASAACALADSGAVLIAARCVQALGGAAAVAGAIELLSRLTGSHQSAARIWGTAGLAGLALGPAIGGILTEALSWQSIFYVQIPILLLVPLALRVPGPAESGSDGKIHPQPEIALAVLSAGLTGAIFLLVVMLTEGWRYSPLEAAAVVTAMPIATVLTSRLAARLEPSRSVIAAGAVAIATGLALLGLLPDADWWWVVPPQVLVGTGIAFSLPGLTEMALGGRDPVGRRAAGTISARHAGVVVGIVLLTPIFDAQLRVEYEDVRRSGTALLLDAPLSPGTKVNLGEAIADDVSDAEGALPSLGPAFASVTPEPEQASDYLALRRGLEDEIDAAATHAFSPSFLIAGALALFALAPILLSRRIE